MVGTESTQAPAPTAMLWKPGAYVAAVAALLLAMYELTSLSAAFLDPAGRAWTFNEVMGPGGWDERAAWSAVLDPEQLEQWRRLFWLYLGLDAIFILTYAAALWSRVGSLLRWPVLALAGVDALETVGAAVLVARRHLSEAGTGGWLVDAVALLTLAKWVIVGLLALAGLLAVALRRRRVWRSLRATWIQRFSLIAFLPIAVLGVVPGTRVTDMFDQLPDVQRHWLNGEAGLLHAAAAGFVHLVILLPAIFLLGRVRADWAARRVAGGGLWPWFTQPAGDGAPVARQHHLRVWLIGPGVLAFLATFSHVRDPGSVVWWRLAAFCAVPLAVWGLSLLLRRLAALAPRLPGAVPLTYADDVMRVGDTITVAALAVVGLGSVRAFTPLAASDFAQGGRGEMLLPAGLAVLGAAVAVLCWPVSASVLRRIAARADVSGDPGASGGFLPWFARIATPGVNVGGGGVDAQPQTTARTVLLAGAILGFVGVCMAPRWVADEFGALAVINAALAALVVMVGVTVAYAQERQRPEVFQLPFATLSLLAAILVCLIPQSLGSWVDVVRVTVALVAAGVITVGFVQALRRRWRQGQPATVPETGSSPVRWGARGTPVVPAFLLAALLANQVGSPEDVHELYQVDDLPTRPTMATAFDNWLARTEACTSVLTLDDGREVEVRPMTMVAAEGGGLRASYWTVAALDEIAAAGAGCGASSTLFSGGASGGALGLTIARFTGDPVHAVETISGSTALGAASASLLGADLLAGTTGIRLLSDTPSRASARAWLDRAGLMETVWEDQLDLSRDTVFLPTEPESATSQPGVTGHLVLTTTVVRTVCRGLLSQVDLGPTKVQCPGGTGPRSFDLLAAYRDCLGNMPALTGGLLASRFPYVTPSASITACGERELAQIVDGGYTDNTGLGTLLNLAPQWRPLVQAHNADVLAGADEPIVVPLVVYLDNGTAKDGFGSADAHETEPSDDPEDQAAARYDWPLTHETLIPPVTGVLRAPGHQIGARSSLSTARGLVRQALCESGNSACEALRTAVGQWAAQRVFVVHQRPEPSVAAPLGWVLSEASQQDLRADIAAQLNAPCPAAGSTSPTRIAPGCQAGYDNLHDLVELLEPSASY